MFYKALLILYFSTFAMAGSLNINDKFLSFLLPDQFDKIHSVDGKLSYIIISFEKENSKIVNEFLSTKSENFLDEKNSVFIADISGMPTIITKMFALPKMRDYKYPILLIYDDKGDKFLRKDDKITIYTLKNTQVSNIDFISSKKELESFFK